MRPHTGSRELVLALQPSSRGLSYVLFEGPQSPVAWGMKDMRGKKKLSLCFEATTELITNYEPEVLVIENILGSKDCQLGRRKRLQRMTTTYAEGRSLDVYAYTRADIRSCFAESGAITRREIAQVIAGRIHAFSRLPPERKLWKSEHRRMYLYDAAALALAYFSRDGHFRSTP